MDNEYVQKLRKEVKKAFKNNKPRYWHTIGVANTCACLAMRYEVDIQKAYVAGLLHDCAKCYSDQELLKACENYSIDVSPSENVSPYLLHAKLGAYYARTVYGIEDEEICSAIKFHSTGRPGMTKLEEIVFIADYIEPFRNKADNLDEIRKIVFEDITEAIYRVTKSTLDYLEKNGRPIDLMTEETCKYYSAMLKARENTLKTEEDNV